MDFRTEEPLASELDRMATAVGGWDGMGWNGGDLSEWTGAPYG